MNHAAAARFLLAVCFLVLLFNGGARFAIGLLLHPMAHDLAWSRSTLSLSVTVFMVLSACALPVVGRLVDRYGARVVLGASVLVSALGLVAMGFIEKPWESLVFYGVVFALGCAGTSVTPVGVLLSRWYPHRMGMANSIAISGMGVGQLLIISVLAVQLTTLGWRGSFLALGIATLVCVLPLVFAMARAGSPAPAPAPGRASGPGRGARTAAAPGDGARTLRAALASRRLQLLLVIYAVCGFQDFLVATHMVAFALDEGVDTFVAGNMLAFMGLAGLVGVLLAGVLNDRFGPVVPTALCFALRIVLCALLLAGGETAVIVGAALLYGVTFWMTAPLAVVFARESAGLALLGTVSGLITMVHHAAGGLGALVGASVFDLYGSYTRAFVALLVLSVVALGLTLILPRRRVAI
ncbi:MAG: MFS transporter [Immundisolibacterales bacterium]|nr:MFS transporter [Immundisolibacterales bacterium]